MWLGDCCVRSCNRLKGIPARVFCLLLLSAQGGVLDYYLITYQNPYSWFWVAFDVLNIAIFITSFFVSKHQLHLQETTDDQTRSFTLGWFAWLIYAVSLVARISIAFTKFAFKLDENDFFGPNTLKTCVALAACVFIFLLMSHHDAPAGSERKAYIDDLTGTVIFDVLDTVDILEVLFDKTSTDAFLPGMQQTILGVAGINIIIPTIPLITLSVTNFGHRKLPRPLVFLHKLLVVLAVNAPNLIVRLILWHGFSVGISPFMLKNVIMICITLYEFYEHKSEKYNEVHDEEIDLKTRDGEGGTSNLSFPIQERFYEV